VLLLLTISLLRTTVNGAFNLAAGTYVQGANDLTVKGNLTIANGATFTKSTDNSKKLKLLGDLTFTDSNATKQNLGIVEIGASPDTTNLSSDMTADSVTVNSGDVLNTKGYDITTGSVSITGTLDTTDTALAVMKETVQSLPLPAILRLIPAARLPKIPTVLPAVSV
jgi:hypothetical protein